MFRSRLRRTAIATGAAVAAIISTSLIVAPTASAVTGPGWTRVWTAPQSYCVTVLGQYAAKGYLTTGCHYYGTPSNGGGYFDYHR